MHSGRTSVNIGVGAGAGAGAGGGTGARAIERGRGREQVPTWGSSSPYQTQIWPSAWPVEMPEVVVEPGARGCAVSTVAGFERLGKGTKW
jgi:hypothetical protein